MENFDIENMMPVLDTETFNSFYDESEVNENVVEKEVTEKETEEEVINIKDLDVSELGLNGDPEKEEDVVKEVTKEGEDDHRLSTLLYEKLVEEGIANGSDAETHSWDDVDAVFNYYKDELPQEVAKALVGSVPEAGKNVIDYILAKGEALTTEDLTSFYEQHLADSKEIVISDVDQAKEFLSAEYGKIMRPSQVTGAIEALEDEAVDGKAILEEAKKIADKQNETRKSVEQLNAVKQDNSKAIAAQRAFAKDVVEELGNVGWKQSTVSAIKKDLSSKRTWDVLGKISNSPKGVVQLAALMRHWDSDKETFNLDAFVKQATSKDVKSFKDKLTEELFNSKEKTASQGKSAGAKATGNIWDHFTPVGV